MDRLATRRTTLDLAESSSLGLTAVTEEDRNVEVAFGNSDQFDRIRYRLDDQMDLAGPARTVRKSRSYRWDF